MMKIKKRKIHIHIKLLLCLIFASLLMTVGYATVNSVVLNIRGTAEMAENGDAKIVSIQRIDIRNLTETQEIGRAHV